MSEAYPDGAVEYNVLITHSHSEGLSDDQKAALAKQRDGIEKTYPFSKFATDPMVNILRNASRINQVPQFIKDINIGIYADKDEENKKSESTR